MSATSQPALHQTPQRPVRNRHFLRVALCVAALANVLVPVVFFSETHFFVQTDPRERALIAAVVAAEYVIVFLLITSEWPVIQELRRRFSVHLGRAVVGRINHASEPNPWIERLCGSELSGHGTLVQVPRRRADARLNQFFRIDLSGYSRMS